MPSRYLLSTAFLDAKFTLAKEKLKEELKSASFISLTADSWTSRATTSYIAVAAHYISEETWELQTALLGCFECQERHTAENIKEELLKVTSEWGITDKVFVCVTDNAANMKSAVKLTGWEHFNCIAHTINLIVRAGLDVIQDSIVNKAKKIAEHFHRSPFATGKLLLMQKQMKAEKKPLKLKIDVITRWNSNIDMLERLLAVQEPLKATLGMLKNPIENLQENEWQALPEVIKILKPFKQLTEKFSSEKEVTISKILAATSSVVRILDNFRPTLTNELTKKMLEKIILEFNGRFKNSSRHLILSKAALLDPRFKKLAFSDATCYEYAKNVLKSELERMTIKQTPENEPENEEKNLSKAVDEDSIWVEFDNLTKSNIVSSNTPSSIVTMRQNLEEKQISRQENPLKWWQKRHILYPELSTLARKYLSMMSSSVPSERIFSKSGQILSERRSSLKPNRMEKILFLNVNQRLLTH